MKKKNILVIRLSAMGDVAMTAPVVARLAEENPELEIYVLTRPLFRPFFGGIPRVHFVDLDLDGRHKGFLGILRLFSDLRAVVKFSYVADLHDVLRSKVLRILFWFTGARTARIDKGRREKSALVRRLNKNKSQLRSTPERYADVFRRLGLSACVPDGVSRRVVDVPSEITALVGEKTGTWIGIAPFAKHRGKIYPLEKMERVVAELNGGGDVRMFVFGGGDIERAVGENWEAMYPHVHSVIKRLRLEQEIDFIANLDVMISMDSASMHIASLVGTPVVSVWGATHPAAGFLGVGQLLDNAVQIDMDCRPCSVYGDRPCFREDHACMGDIEPEDVTRAVRRIITVE